MNVIYPAIFHHEDNAYWVEFPDLPGCQTFGDEIGDTLLGAKEALSGHCAALLELGQKLPKPSQMGQIKAPNDDAFVTLVDTRVDGVQRAVKKTLTIPYWLNARAEAMHAPYSQLLQEALEKFVGAKDENQPRV